MTEEGDTAEAPAAFRLHNAYPNPFNPATTIGFTLREPGTVRLAVYSQAGQRVATLVDGPVSAGTHAVRFDGSGLASGVYVCRLDTAAGTASGTMTLVK